MSVVITKNNGGWLLETEVVLNAPLKEVFPFFAEARNLELITPSFLEFKVVSEGKIDMRVGTEINYRLKLHKIPISWKSEITQWDPPNLFCDEQRRGPYRYWVHHHEFIEKEAKTIARDKVRYSVYGGELIHRFFVKSDVEKIFRYRQEKLQSIFS